VSAAVRRRVLVAGRVQAVGFRVSCAHRAAEAGLGGYVRNLPDGRLEAAFEGPPDAVAALVAWCRVGPPLASVTAVAVADEPVLGETRFAID
jgi:acylphosphatase